MKEIDTEAPVIWPAWCYSGNVAIEVKLDKCLAEIEKLKHENQGNIPTDLLKQTPATANTAVVGVKTAKPTTSSSSLSSASSTSSNCSTEIAAYNNSNSNSNCNSDIVTHKSPIKRKSNNGNSSSTTRALRQALTPAKRRATSTRLTATVGAADDLTATVASDNHNHNSDNNKHRLASTTAEKMLSERSLRLSGFNAIESAKKLCDSINISSAEKGTSTATPTSTAAAAAAYLYLEKVKNEKLSPRMTAVQIESLKDAFNMDSSTVSVISNNNNNILSNNNNSNSLGSRQSPTGPNNASNNNNIQQQHLGSSSVKRERLSPGTNGDMQGTLSRSRSATPSSFRGTPPQQTQNSPSETLVPIHNLSTNLLNSISQAATTGRHNSAAASTGGNGPTDFSTRNYSDIMRSLAAKYNNSNPNDSSSVRRNSYFDSSASSNSNKVPLVSKPSTSSASTSSSLPSTLASKEASTATAPPAPPAMSPSDVAAAALKSAAAAAVANSSNVSPFMTSFLSSLPFSQGVFPPLIDMSSTQALVTLARAAKEAEIQSILRSAQQPKRPSSSNSSNSPRPSLSAALQQAAQFVSPAFIYSAQLQQAQSQAASSQSSPVQVRSTGHNAAGGDKSLATATPLDLSSQPPSAKRFKAESTSSRSSTDGLLDTTLENRRASSITSSPSPPLSEKSQTGFSAKAESSVPTTKRASKSTPNIRQCQAQSEEVNSWTVDDVCAFVGGIDICREYVQHFRDQCIDGSGLPLLTEDHLVNSLGMKLGPALKLRSMMAKKLGGPCPCVTCVAQAQQMLALQASGCAATTSSAVTGAGPATTRQVASRSPRSPQQQHQHQQVNATPFSNTNDSSTHNNNTETARCSNNPNGNEAITPSISCSTNVGQNAVVTNAVDDCSSNKNDNPKSVRQSSSDSVS